MKKKAKQTLEKQIAKQIKDTGKVAKALKDNKGKLKKIGLKVKGTTWIDEKGNRQYGGCIEVLESNSKIKWLDGINLDLGATDNFDIMLGISKDLTIAGKQEFSIGGYINATDLSKQLWNKYKKNSNDPIKVKVKLGISKVF